MLSFNDWLHLFRQDPLHRVLQISLALIIATVVDFLLSAVDFAACRVLDIYIPCSSILVFTWLLSTQ